MRSSSFDNNGFESEIVAKKRGCEEEGAEEGLKALFTRGRELREELSSTLRYCLEKGQRGLE